MSQLIKLVTLEKWVTLVNLSHTWKNWSDWKKCHTWKSRSNLEKWVTFGKPAQTWINGSH